MDLYPAMIELFYNTDILNYKYYISQFTYDIDAKQVKDISASACPCQM